MRFVLLALALGLAACNKQQPTAVPDRKQGYVRETPVHPFPEAASVRLLVETGYDEKAKAQIYRDPHGRLLTSGQREQYEALLMVQTPVNLAADDSFFLMTSCFIPHHFFRYFDKAGRQIGEISVCFCCSGVEMTPDASLALKEGQRFEANYAKLKALVQSWGEPTNVECSPEGRSG